MQKPCKIKLPSTKSAKARSLLIRPGLSSTDSPGLVILFAALDAVGGARSLVCMRSEAVSTNWPTLALKPERKALNGYMKENVLVGGSIGGRRGGR